MTPLETQISDLILHMDGRDPEAGRAMRARYTVTDDQPELHLARAIIASLSSLGVGKGKLPNIKSDEIKRVFPFGETS